MPEVFIAREMVWCAGAGADPVHGYNVEQQHNGQYVAQQFMPADTIDDLEDIVESNCPVEWILLTPDK